MLIGEYQTGEMPSSCDLPTYVISDRLNVYHACRRFVTTSFFSVNGYA